MAGGNVSKTGTAPPDPRGGGWPVWAKRLASVAIIFQATAALAAALAWPPSSLLERSVADRFTAYYQVFDQGYAYRYYAPEPGPTPIVTATVRFDDGRPDRAVRLPSRGVWPRLRYQRQLALANHLTDHLARTRGDHDGSHDLLARSYARHIAGSMPGCESVTLYTQLHRIPDWPEVRGAVDAGHPVDLDAEEFYTAPERIGEYRCDEL